jgi:dTDP-4-dehydrorhamnose 3,5-epimerase
VTPAEPIKDRQTVDADGRSIAPRIHGVEISYLRPQEDDRGELCEVWTAARDPLGIPVVHVYMVTIRPGTIRGWVMHAHQHDRIFIQQGRLRVGLYDARPDSPTHGMLNVMTFSDHNRALLVYPPGVWHGIQNVGEHEAVFLNLPTRAYNYEDPDKFRLPITNDLIPFAFEERRGW